MQVNTNPCMDLCNALLSSLIPAMLEATLELTEADKDTQDAPQELDKIFDEWPGQVLAALQRVKREIKEAEERSDEFAEFMQMLAKVREMLIRRDSW